MPASIPEEKINQLLADSEIYAAKMGKKTTVVHATLPNTFEVVASAACNSPAEYDHEVGKQVAMKRLRDKVWELAGAEAHGLLFA